MRPLFVIAILASLLTGCASTHRKTEPGADTVSITETGIASIPVTATPQMPSAEKTALDDAPIPVYINPRVAKVHVAAYINDKGEAFQDAYKYVFVDEGHWNIEALHNPERAYIPAENVPKPQAAPGVIWGAVAPGEVSPQASSEHVPARKLFDLDQIRVTGYFDRADEPKARQEAGNLGEEFGPPVVIYDDDLGWIIVPQAALTPTIAISRAGPMEAPPTAAEKPSPPKSSDDDIR
jgi:Type IV conjugative transfer system lipoprotein (TraV)